MPLLKNEHGNKTHYDPVAARSGVRDYECNSVGIVWDVPGDSSAAEAPAKWRTAGPLPDKAWSGLTAKPQSLKKSWKSELVQDN